jgi:hypothetical protein
MSKYTGWFEIIVGVSVAYNFQIGKNKIKLLMKYESITKKVFFDNAVFIMYAIKIFELHFRIP